MDLLRSRTVKEYQNIKNDAGYARLYEPLDR